jgi:hypothetical protein
MRRYMAVMIRLRMSPAITTFLGLYLLKSHPTNGRDRKADREKIPSRKPICCGLPPRFLKYRESRISMVMEEKDIKTSNWMGSIPGANFIFLI